MNTNVWQENGAEIFLSQLRNMAVKQNRIMTIPDSLEEWKNMRENIRQKIWEAAGVEFDDSIDLEYQEHNSRNMDGYEIRGISYKSREGIYVTGNLYIPEGKGPFPAVLNMHGHWSQGRLAERVQARAATQAQNGYVALAVDAFGSGERSDEHGNYEYHGSNLGASLFDIGESLLGAQIVDNMRGVSVLCSLPYVDKERIGATGASGGGNQTMWVAAMDDRIKAAMPVVSVGTFESYIDRMNCICECLPGGMKFTEEWGVLSLVAPRALKICNCLHDSNPTFFPSEMLRSYKAAKNIFRLYDKGDSLANEVFKLPHGYWPDIRESMLGWFERFLKGNGDGSAIAEKPLTLLPEEDVMLFEKGKRPGHITGIAQYCIDRANAIAKENSSQKIDKDEKINALKKLVCLDMDTVFSKAHQHGTVKLCNRNWQKITIETSNGSILPVLLSKPLEGNNWLIATHKEGKGDFFKENENLINTTKDGILAFDLPFTGELIDERDIRMDYKHAAASRAFWWLGRSLLGEWVKYINITTTYLKENNPAEKLAFFGVTETAVAGLMAQVISRDFSSLTLKKLPDSFIYDKKKCDVSMGLHIPGIIPWGDIKLALELAECKIEKEDF